MISLIISLLAAEPARTTLSLQTAPLFAGGVTIQAERATESLKWSFAVSLGARAAAAGLSDFTALNVSLGLEARRWWHVGPLSGSAFGALGGPFVWLRGDLVAVSLSKLDGTGRGTALHPGASAGVGYRLMPVWRLEIAPTAGVAVDPLAHHLSASFGLTLGVVF